MKLSSMFEFMYFGITTVLFKRKDPLVGSIILTDKCNLSCNHCVVNNITATVYPYSQIKSEMLQMYADGIRILLFYGGEPFLWKDQGLTVRDLVIEAKQIGFVLVNIVTAINQINKSDIEDVCMLARRSENIKAVSFNFHTPYPGTEYLKLTAEQKQSCCDEITKLIKEGYPVLNLKSAFPYIVKNTFKTPCYQCIIMENGRKWVCGRCNDIKGLCRECGFFFAAEYSLVFQGNLKVILKMFRTYLKYI
jgi:MoaA/NifB/PqqE/SkfB family radical SAM enzyme